MGLQEGSIFMRLVGVRFDGLSAHSRKSRAGPGWEGLRPLPTRPQPVEARQNRGFGPRPPRGEAGCSRAHCRGRLPFVNRQ
jgi:hypothetical protein